MRFSIVVGVLLWLILAPLPAQGQVVLPTLKLGVGAPVAPSTFFAGATSPTAPATRDPLVREMARSLDYNIDFIFAYLRNNIEITPSYGLQKGARGVILDGYGTTFDQAQAFVDMLRESDAAAGTGYNAQYVLGEITLTSAQFSSWFGVTDAGSAAAVLADGGIPASVTGSGTSFSVTMSHIWVAATVNGSTYVFDPSYKPHTVISPGLTLPTAMSSPSGATSPITYSAADLISQGVGGASVNTASQISGFNVAAFQNRLTAYRANLEAYLLNPANGLVGARTDNVIGHRSITAMTGGPSRQSTLSYQASGTSGTTWSGQIPNAYRTSFTVQIGSGTPTTYYADQMYGKPMLFGYSVSSTGVASGSLLSPVAGDGTITPTLHLATYRADATYPCEAYPASATAGTATMSIAIYHPYPGSNGQAGYMNRTIQRNLAISPCGEGRFILTNDWGDMGSKVTDLMRRGLAPLNYAQIYTYLCPTNPGSVGDCGTSTTEYAPDYPSGPQLESVAAQLSAYLRLAGQTEGGQYQLHDLIGIHTLDNVGLEEVGNSIYGSSTSESYNGLMLSMDFEGGVSVNPINGVNSNLKAGLVRVAQGGLAAAESGVSRQESDSPRDVTSLTQMVKNSGVLNGSYYLLSSANWSNLTGYPAAATAIMGQYISAGYSIFAPAQGQLGEATASATVLNGTETWTMMDAVPGNPARVVAIRPTFFAFNPSTGDGAFLIYDPRRQWVLKGGSDVTQMDPSSGLVRKPDSPTPSSKDLVFNELSINGRTGDLSYAPPADITDGVGGFPKSLSLTRRYDPTDVSDYGLGIGWKTNWRQMVTINNDGQAALGSSGAYGAASALVAIQSTIDMVSANLSANGADYPEYLLSEAAAQEWFVSSTINNSVTVASGFDGDEVFLRAADGVSLVAAQPTGATLVESGLPAGSTLPPDSIINKRLYYQLTFTYTGKTGDVKTYNYLPTSPIPVALDEPMTLGFLTQHSFWANNWTFPDGVVVKPIYSWVPGGAGMQQDIVYLASVTNNLGFGLNALAPMFGGEGAGNNCIGNHGNPVPTAATPSSIQYQTSYQHALSSSVSVTYMRAPLMTITEDCSPDVATTASDHDKAVSSTLSYSWPLMNSFIDQLGNTWNYSYATVNSTYDDQGTPSGATPDGAAYNGQLLRLSTIYKPSAPSPATPAAAITMGLDGRVWTIADALSNVHTYYTSPFFTNDVDPVNASTQTTYDEYGRRIAETDPIGRTTTYQYDIRDRLAQTTHPLGDYVTNDAYDARSNLLQTTRHPMPGSSLAPTVTSTAYVEGNTVTCVNIVICNKPATMTDALGNVTNISWNSASGLPIQILKPADANGLRPESDFVYTPLTVGGSTCPGSASAGGVALLCQKTDKISSTSGVVTNYGYLQDGYSKYFLSTVTVDPTGLNLRTCFKFDETGNLISTSDPRLTGSCP